jgi:hypothetical protein
MRACAHTDTLITKVEGRRIRRLRSPARFFPYHLQTFAFFVGMCYLELIVYDTRGMI